MTIEETVGQNVHELIWRKKLGHRPIYTALGITRFTLQKKLRGDIGWSASDIATTAEVLGVDPGRLFEVTRDYRGSRLHLVGLQHESGNDWLAYRRVGVRNLTFQGTR